MCAQAEDTWLPLIGYFQEKYHFPYWYFDPIKVKLRAGYGSAKSSAQYTSVENFNIERTGTDETCSKVRNQLGHRHEENFRFNTPRNLRIILGHACNFRCKYCAQKHGKLRKHTPQELDSFMARLDQNLLYDELALVQFWGGEPLLYWPEIQYLMKEFKKRFKITGAGFSMATNGSLLDMEITQEILEEEQFGFILSHDGPGQALRGQDPLEPGTMSRRCLELLARVKNRGDIHRVYANQGRNFAVNPVITSQVKSLQDLVAWYDDVFGMEVPIAECIPMIPIQPGTEPYAPNQGDWGEYEAMIARDVAALPIERFDNYKLLYELFIEKFLAPDFTVNPTKATCFTTDPYMLTVDLDGNVFPCQTYDATQSLMPDGSRTVAGTLSKDVTRPTSKRVLPLHFPTLHNWVDTEPGSEHRAACASCPVVSFCMGGCPYLVGKAAQIDCNAKKAHFRGLLKVFLSRLFGISVSFE